MKQWQHIFFKYLRYEPCGVVLRCLPSEEAVGLAILKKKSEGDVGPGPMGLGGNISFFLIFDGAGCMKCSRNNEI